MPSNLFVGWHSSTTRRLSQASFLRYYSASCIALIAVAPRILLVKGILPHIPERPSFLNEQPQTPFHPSQNDLWRLVESASTKPCGTIGDSSSQGDLAWLGFLKDPTAEKSNKIEPQPHRAFEENVQNDFQLGRGKSFLFTQLSFLNPLKQSGDKLALFPVEGDHARLLSSPQHEPVSMTSTQFLDPLLSSFYTDGSLPHHTWTDANHPYDDLMARISAVKGQSRGDPKAGHDYHRTLTVESSSKTLPADSQVNRPFWHEKALPMASRMSREGVISGVSESEDPHQLSAFMEELSGRHLLSNSHYLDRYSGIPVHTSAHAQNLGRDSAFVIQEKEPHEKLLNAYSIISANVDQNSGAGKTHGLDDEEKTPNNLDLAEMNSHLTIIRHKPVPVGSSNTTPLKSFPLELQATHENGMGSLQAVNHYPMGDANLEYIGLDRWASGLLEKAETEKKSAAGRMPSLFNPGPPFETHLHATNLGYPPPDVEKGPTGTRPHSRKVMLKAHAYSPITRHAPFLKEFTPPVRRLERNGGVSITPESRVPSTEINFSAETSYAQTRDNSASSGVFPALPSNSQVSRQSDFKFPRRFQRHQEDSGGLGVAEPRREEHTSHSSGNTLSGTKRRKLDGEGTIRIQDVMPWWCRTRKGPNELSKCLQAANPILGPTMLRFLDESKKLAQKMPLLDRSKISVVGRLQKYTYEFLQMQLQAQKYLEPNLEIHEIQNLVEQGYEWLVGLWNNLDLHQILARDLPSFNLETHLEENQTMETITLLHLRSEPASRIPRQLLGYLLYEWIESQRNKWIPIINSRHLDPRIPLVRCRPFQLFLVQLKNFEKQWKD